MSSSTQWSESPCRVKCSVSCCGTQRRTDSLPLPFFLLCCQLFSPHRIYIIYHLSLFFLSHSSAYKDKTNQPKKQAKHLLISVYFVSFSFCFGHSLFVLVYFYFRHFPIIYFHDFCSSLFIKSSQVKSIHYISIRLGVTKRKEKKRKISKTVHYHYQTVQLKTKLT